MKNSAILKGDLVVSTEFYETELPADSVDCPLWVVSGCVYDGTKWLWLGGKELKPEELAQLQNEFDDGDDRTRLEKQRPIIRDFGTGTNAERITRLESVLAVVVRNLTRQ